MADGRALSLWCTLLALTLAGGLVAWRAGPLGALTVVALLCSSADFIAKILEFRPDVPAMMFLVAALALLATRHALGAGVASGLALLCTPKCVFAIAGLVISLAGPGRPKEGRGRALARFGLGLGLPLLAMAVWLFRAGALSEAVQFALIEAARWQGPSPGPFLIDFIRTDVALAGLFAFATLRSLRYWTEADRLTRSALFMAWAGLGGLFLVTYPSRQFLLLTVPACAVAATLAADRLIRRRLPREWQRAMTHSFLAAAIVAMGWPEHLRAFARGNTAALVAMEQIADNTDAREIVLDGFIGYAPLRRYGTFFPFLHRDVRELRERLESPPLLDALRTGRLFPKFALMNHYLQEGVDPAVWNFLEVNYAPLDQDPEVRVRVFDNGLGYWSDGTRRSLVPTPGREPHLLTLGGWSAPRLWAGRSGRWLVGRDAGVVLIPIREPGPLDLVVSISASEALTLEVEINGSRLPPQALVVGEQDATIEAPAEVWRRGLNRAVLTITPPGRRTCFVSSLQVRPR